MSNGEDIVVRIAFKPTATILRPQETVDESGAELAEPVGLDLDARIERPHLTHARPVRGGTPAIEQMRSSVVSWDE